MLSLPKQSEPADKHAIPNAWAAERITGADVSAITPMPIPADLQAVLDGTAAVWS